MKKKSSFENKYPLLVPYIPNELIRENMTYNIGLEEKYKHTQELIERFICELSKYYDEEEVSDMLQETFLKLEESDFVSFINAYLHSCMEIKKNKECLFYFRKTLRLGKEAVSYIEKKGIIIGRKYMEIPLLVADLEYERYATGEENYKGKSLKEKFESLTLEQKGFLLPFVKEQDTFLLSILFSSFEEPLATLIEFLNHKNITHHMINKKSYNALGESLFIRLILLLLRQSTKELVDNVGTLLEKERFSILSSLIQCGLLENLEEMSLEDLETLDDMQIMALLTKTKKNLKKSDN